MRVKASPAREPNGLEPPTPLNAPTRPPPLPRWIRTSRIRKRPRKKRTKFNRPGNHDHTARSPFREDSAISDNQTVIIGSRRSGEKTTSCRGRKCENGYRVRKEEGCLLQPSSFWTCPETETTMQSGRRLMAALVTGAVCSALGVTVLIQGLVKQLDAQAPADGVWAVIPVRYGNATET